MLVWRCVRGGVSILGDVGDTQILLLSRTHWGNVWDMTRHSDIQQKQQQQGKSWHRQQQKQHKEANQTKIFFNDIRTYNKKGTENKDSYKKNGKTHWKAKFAALNDFVNNCIVYQHWHDKGSKNMCWSKGWWVASKGFSKHQGVYCRHIQLRRLNPKPVSIIGLLWQPTQMVDILSTLDL